MALTHDYTLICEHARPEAGGKFTIIGLFPIGIQVPQIPFAFPVLTFFSALRADSPGLHSFTGSLSVLEGGAPLVNAKGMIQAIKPGPVMMPFPLTNLQLRNPGTYSWMLEIEGQNEPFVTQFQVALMPPPPQFAPHLGRPRT
jgi:uncharacterized protein DUF6941